MSEETAAESVKAEQSRTDRTGVVALLAANLISLVGNQVTHFALPWFVLAQTGSAAQTALVAATQMGGYLLATIWGVVLVDRFGPKWLSVVADAVSFVSIISIPILIETVGLDLWQILVLVLGGVILDSPGNNARYGILTDLIERTRWSGERVYSAFSSADGIARISGPVLAGGLIAWVGAVNALWIDAATFAVSGLLVAVFVPKTSRPQLPPSSFFGDIRGGWDYLRSKPLLVRFFALVVCVNLTAVPLAAVVIPKIARDHYESARVGGVMLAADGAGVILGGLLFGVIGRRLTAYRTMLFALVVFFLSLTILGALPPVPVSVIALGLTGIGFGVLVPNNQILYRRFIDVEFRGRLLGLRDAVVGISAPTMVVIVGIALDIAPIAPVVIALGLINLAVLIWFLREPVFQELKVREAPPRPG